MSPDGRPDPDQLLARVQAEEARAGRGHLKVFFGAAAGVGKTCAMLEAARARHGAGDDVLVGVVETHGRTLTAELAATLPRLPPRDTVHRGVRLSEFDLDAALARRPALILVDELAHSNAPGSRHLKRWQDVEELLTAGIAVYTTVNVQHLESLNDVVARITGVRVAETVPDWVFDEADEVELVDLPADELITRLAEGRVYQPEQAQRAAGHFFRKGNLIALRELALRRTTDRVDAQMRSWRDEQSIPEVWQVSESLLVALGGTDAERLVRAGRRIAQRLHTPWYVVHVETPRLAARPYAERRALVEALRLAESLGAAVHTLSGQDVADELLSFARSHNVARIVLGRGRRRTPWRRSLSERLAARADDVEQVIVARRARPPAALADWLAASRSFLGVDRAEDLQHRRHALLWGALTPLALTAAVWPLFPALEPINLIMLYLLAVVAIAYRHGALAATLASMLSVGLFDFFFIPPHFTFAVSDTQYLLTFAVMLLVALVISRLTGNMREQARHAGFRERRTAMLYALVQALSQARGRDELLQGAVSRLAEGFQCQAVVLLPRGDGQLALPSGDSVHGSLHGADLAVAQWVYDNGEAAGTGTATLPGADALYLALTAPSGRQGVLAVSPPRDGSLREPEERRLLDTAAAQIALALERLQLAERNEAARLAAQNEELRNTLLTSISHDLRTPLAGIVGSASTLAEITLPDAERRAMAQGIQQEALRMSSLVSSVLDMARLQAGAVQIRPEWLPLEEVIGAALDELGPRLAAHPLTLALPDGLALVWADGRLLTRVLVNLLDNAAKYTPPGSHLQLAARLEAAQAVLTLDDDGPGLGDAPERLFGKFQRARSEDNSGGVGLGLAICRHIVEAHGGTLVASNLPQGGARFTLTLPSPGLPPELEAE